jgi:CubicO group peptidase (beta-lactamase class C family)
VGEVIRRVDGRSLGSFLAEEVARPLEADVHIGLAADAQARVADFLWPGLPPVSFDTSDLDEKNLMHFYTYNNPPGLSGAGYVNTPEWRAAEIPSTNGHGTARGVARIYAALAADGRTAGTRLLGADALAEMTRVHSDGTDVILGRPSRFGLGVQLTQPERPLGPNAGAYGHFGAGGSLGFCDPEARLAFGYVMNAMGPRWQNPRNRALIDAVYACL